MARAIDTAVRALQRSGVVVFPTDTLWGLGADARDRSAVAELSRLKDRPSGQPISIAVSSLEEIEPLAELSASARRCLRSLLPGPYTALVRASPSARQTLAPEVIGPSRTIGVRVPDHPIARELARRVGVLTATSANRHGAPPAGSAREAQKVFGANVAHYVALGPRPSGHPSMIVDLRREEPRFLPRA